MAIIPDAATAPALIVVGVLMMGAVKHIEWDDFGIAMPAFLTIAMMPFSYSIANGVLTGVIFYVVLNTVRNLVGKDKEKAHPVHPLMWVVAILAVLRYIFLAGQ
jgi:AGZA family xanthine/uracil permease-like MFS transporter